MNIFFDSSNDATSAPVFSSTEVRKISAYAWLRVRYNTNLVFICQSNSRRHGPLIISLRFHLPHFFQVQLRQTEFLVAFCDLTSSRLIPIDFDNQYQTTVSARCTGLTRYEMWTATEGVSTAEPHQLVSPEYHGRPFTLLQPFVRW